MCRFFDGVTLINWFMRLVYWGKLVAIVSGDWKYKWLFDESINWRGYGYVVINYVCCSDWRFVMVSIHVLIVSVSRPL